MLPTSTNVTIEVATKLSPKTEAIVVFIAEGGIICGDAPHVIDQAALDSIDRRLLAELQAEGRVTNVELAQRVGLTAPPCLRRVRALEEAGVIKGYHAELDASKLGFAIR